MKNKIIFKTLMLKGEAGSTIVSMEKTGHVGTADIYTITFNDGSTTEISLENMSAITSVEKTSSTDTEDIYTITCADGSTQTFSVLNHNADIAAMSADISDMADEISTIDARVDNLVTDVAGAETTTLWSGNMSADGGTYTLSESVSNFDFIDIYYDNQYTGVADYLRIPASKTSAAVYIPMFETGSENKPLEIGKVALTFSGTSVTVAAAKQYYWDGTSASDATVLNAQNSFPVRIDGVKTSASVNAELADVRVGADGVTYGSAGAAVRGQISDVRNDFNAVSGLVGVDRKFTGTVSTANVTTVIARSFIKKDHTYTFTASFPSALAYNVYFYVFNKGTTSNPLLQLNMTAGTVTKTGKITASVDAEIDIAVYITSAVETTINVDVTDSNGLAAEIHETTFDIAPLGDSEFKLSDYFTFKNGGMWHAAWVSSTLYQVMCDTVIKFDFDVTLLIANNFKIGVHTLVNGVFDIDSGWITGTYKIPAGTYFKIVIARYTEITTETADIDLFTSMVTVKSNSAILLDEKTDKLNDDLLNGYSELKLPEWEQGSITGSGQLGNSTTDIRSSFAVHVPAGEYWIDPHGIKTYYFYYTAVGAYSKNCSVDRKWGVTAPFRIKFETDVYLRFVQSVSTGMLPEDANLTITKVFPKLPFELKYYRNGISVISKQGEGLGVPPQSLISIKEAFKNLYDGYRINVCKTSDGYYVLSHDRSINSIAKNPDNSDISTTINIDEHTLAELNEYDYGIRYGTQFAGMKITQLDDAVALCAKLGLKVNLEWKFPTMTSDDAEAMYDTMVTNGFSNKNWRWIATNTTEIDYFKSVCDYVDIAVLITTASISYYLPTIEYAMSSKHDVVVGYSDGNLTDAQVIQLRKLNVTQNRGTATNISQMIAQIESGVTEIECNFYNPKQAMIEYAMSN